MTNHDDERQHREELLRIHRKNAHTLEQQMARYGLSPPVHLVLALEHEREQIAALTATLEPAEPHVTLAGETDQLVQPAQGQPLARAAASALAPLESAPLVRLTRPLPGPRRTLPPIRQILRRTHHRALSWFTAGGVAFALFIGMVVLLLLRPNPNPALVEQIRDQAAGASNHTIQLTAHDMAPAQLHAHVGELMALTVVNQSEEARTWLLLDADRAAAEVLLADGMPAQHEEVRRSTRLLQPGERAMLTFVPFRSGTFTLVSMPEAGPADMWGSIEAVER